MAEDVLRLAGFVEHINYEKQIAVEGGRSIPDFTFMLPKGHVLYMDVKFPLTAYLRYLQATTDDERSRERQQFLRDVRLKVKELARRDYLDRARISCDQLLLFIPNESVSAFIHECDPSLIDDALRDKIVFCSPLTLFAMLGVIRQAFDTVMLEQTSDEVLRLVGALRTQFDKYTEAVDKLGKRLESVQSAFDDLNGTRRRALERPLAKADELRRERGLGDRARPRGRRRRLRPPRRAAAPRRAAESLPKVSEGGGARGPAVARASAGSPRRSSARRSTSRASLDWRGRCRRAAPLNATSSASAMSRPSRNAFSATSAHWRKIPSASCNVSIGSGTRP